MNHESIRFQNVSYTYDAMSTTLLEGLTLTFPIGWTGIVGPNGAGKTTVLRLATGGLQPQDGSVHRPDGAIYCPQRTDDSPDELDDLLGSTEAAACELKGRLGIAEDWPRRWCTLSHGERKRAQIAVALWRQPPVLAVDEPSNHLDADARDLLTAALRSYRGVGLLVSQQSFLSLYHGQSQGK